MPSLPLRTGVSQSRSGMSPEKRRAPEAMILRASQFAIQIPFWQAELIAGNEGGGIIAGARRPCGWNIKARQVKLLAGWGLRSKG